MMAANEQAPPTRKPVDRVADSPISWIVLGVALGLGLGVTSWAPLLVGIGLVAWGSNMLRHDPKQKLENMRVFGGPAFSLGWVAGFVIRGVTGID